MAGMNTARWPLVTLMLAGWLAPLAPAAEPKKEGPFLINDLAAARVEAAKTGKPLFVVFRCEA